MRAFILAGGASLGAVQAGMLRALYERGVAPDLIVATSAGAVNGAFIASRPPTVDTAAELEDIWIGLKRSDIFPINPFTGLVGVFGRADHLVPNSGLRRLVERHVQFERLEDATVPLHVIATDLLRGTDVRLSSGPAVDAVLASSSIPAVFPPICRDGRLLIDGGVVDNTPVSHAAALGAKELYVLPTGSPCALDAPPRGALDAGLHALTVLIHQRLADDIETARQGKARIVVLPPPCPMGVHLVDFSQAAELIEAGYRSAARALARVGDSDSIPQSLRPHSHAELASAV